MAACCSRSGSGIEHSVHVLADGGGGHGHGHGQGEAVATPPERRLNCFLRFVALIERLGNALGTLAFTWATVVLLGGYPTALRDDSDYWFVTTMFFLEGFRIFSRQNRMDYQLFFGTRGAFRLLGWSGLILILYFNGVVCMIARKWDPAAALFLPVLGTLVAVGQFLCPGAPRLLARIPLQRAISLWSPVGAIILLAPSVLQVDHHRNEETYTLITVKPVARWTVYAVLLVVVLIVTVSRMTFPREFWRRVVLNLCMIAAIVLATFSFSRDSDEGYGLPVMVAIQVSTIILVSFGNFQIPAAVLRLVLPLISFGSIPDNYKNKKDDACINLAPSLYIFYGMVLAQGALYLMACVVEIFSFLPRRFLIHRGGFRGRLGVHSVNLYYTYALDKCMERNVLSPKISLCSFAIDYLNSDSTKKQLNGILTAHTLLQRDATRTKLLMKLKASTKTMTRLMRMLHWTGRDNEATRLFAAKITGELAKSLLVVNSPGIVQSVSLLLDYGSQRKKRNPLLETDVEKEQNDDLFLYTTGNQMEREDEVPDSGSLLQTQACSTQQIGSSEHIPDSGSLLQTQARSTQQIGSNEHNSWIAKWWRQVFEFWSAPQEEPLTEQDLPPVIGMMIIERLATYDQSNCAEISKATDLIWKITRFTKFCRTDTNYTDAEKKVLVHSSLKLVYRLTSIDGEIGITLRHKISSQPFLLRNLSEILPVSGDIRSNYETRKLVAGIIRNLAIDASMRQTIGRAHRIITRLMHVFVTPNEPSTSSGTEACVYHSRGALRKVAGQALAILAIGNVDSCLTMLRQSGYSFIEKLINMIQVERYRCVAASLLQSVCMHARPELSETNLKLISRVVMERILHAKGEELEIFIGLTSYIYKAIPESSQDFEFSHIKETFAKRLVDALNANMEPIADCPGIRRVILEQAIKLMEHDYSSNVTFFRNIRMIEILSMVEETISEAENYTIFMGDVGLMEAGKPLSSLVGMAKQLLEVR